MFDLIRFLVFNAIFTNIPSFEGMSTDNIFISDTRVPFIRSSDAQLELIIMLIIKDITVTVK